MASYFKCKLNKPAISYKCGEVIRFEVFAMNKGFQKSCNFIRWELKNDDGKIESGLGSCGVGRPLVLETTLERPGFVRINCKAVDENGNEDKEFDVLDASAGAEVEKIEYHDTLPDDFYEYWENIEKMVADCPIEILFFNEVSAENGFKAYDIRLKTPEGRPASLFLTVPDKDGKFPIKYTFMAYALVGADKTYNKDMITACINAHGIENDISKDEIMEKYPDIAGGYGFNQEENSSKMTTYWRGVAIRNLMGAKYLKTVEKWDGNTFILAGGSQAGLQATTVAAHIADVTYLELSIPWFCDLGGANHGFMSGWRPSYAEGVRYFDTVAQAMQVKCPVKIRAHLGDYVCPPSTIMALYNSIKTAKTLTFVQAATHGYNPYYIETFSLTCDSNDSQNELKKGIYRHFKGNEYEVLDIGLDCETLKETVIYRALYGERKIWLRPKDDFCELIFKNGKVFKRFEFIK